MKKWITLLCTLLFLAVLGYAGNGMEKARETAGELLDQEHPRIALTFDDGPHSVYTEKLLDGLKERDIRATFFLIGKNIEGNEDVVKRIQEEGHLISRLLCFQYPGMWIPWTGLQKIRKKL